MGHFLKGSGPGSAPPAAARAASSLRGAAMLTLCVGIAAALGMLQATPELSLFRSNTWPFPSPSAAFAPVPGVPKLHKLPLDWFITPFHKETLDVYALEHTPGFWALSDAGGYDTPLQSHASALLRALEALVGEGTLTHVLCTRPPGLPAARARCSAPPPRAPRLPDAAAARRPKRSHACGRPVSDARSPGPCGRAAAAAQTLS